MDQSQSSPAILVVEDEPLIRLIAADVLEHVGLRPLEAADAAEALELLDRHPEVALLFTDVNMPGSLDGLQLAERVHATRPEVELIVTSGRQALDEKSLPDHGSFLPKPYSQAQLLDLVAKKLRLH